MAADLSDDQLVESARRGDASAFGELTVRHKNRVFGLVSRFAAHGADLEDICQEVFIQAWFNLGQFRRESPFEHWIFAHRDLQVLRLPAAPQA